MDKIEPLPAQSEWSFELLEKIDEQVGRVARNFGLDTYTNQLDIITSEQMMDAYSSIGLPIYYNHWSFGKSFIETEREYVRGESGLAYEIVINSNPCIAYLMEENSLMMQTLVIAHASYGHNSFFKGNYLFREWTDAEGIVDYMLFAKNYILDCEDKYGKHKVERLLDACHALQNLGVDKYKRPEKLSLAEEKARQKERAEYAQTQVNELWSTLPTSGKPKKTLTAKKFLEDPEENILYFIEKHAPKLKEWEREIVRIVRKISQYFYPQRQTQVMNEGWATFWHYTILNQLYEEGVVGDGFMLEFLKSHTSVVTQRSDMPMNPYALGFAMMSDIKRMCENPTEEDKHWFPGIVNTDWKETLDFAMRNFRDESFISQYLSPKVIRDFRMFIINDNQNSTHLRITGIHDEAGYRLVRETLASKYRLTDNEPNIQILNVAMDSDREMIILHTEHDDRPLAGGYKDVQKHLAYLWGFKVTLINQRGMQL